MCGVSVGTACAFASIVGPGVEACLALGAVGTSSRFFDRAAGVCVLLLGAARAVAVGVAVAGPVAAVAVAARSLCTCRREVGMGKGKVSEYRGGLSADLGNSARSVVTSGWEACTRQ